MNLSDLGAHVADFAPLLGKLLPIPGAGIAGDLIAAAFGTENEPDAIMAAIKADPDAGIKLAAIESNNKAAIESQLIAAETNRIESVNKTMRTEAAANDAYVRRWRPTIGYVVAFQFFMLGWVVFVGVVWAVRATDPAQTTAIMTGLAGLIGAMTVIITAECAVLGVNIGKRSQDKSVAAGHPPTPSLVATLASKFAT